MRSKFNSESPAFERLRGQPSKLAATSLIIALAVAGPLGCAFVQGNSSTSGIPETFFGMTVIGSSNWPQDSFGALGKGTLVNWAYSEPQKGVFDWSNLDAWVAAAENHKLSFFFSNDLIPPWAAADQTSCGPAYPGSAVIGCKSMVTNISDWDHYVTALATRYKGKLMYELWNEPHMYFTGSVSDMVTLTTHELSIIRSIDPNALILAPSGSTSFMDQYFAAGGPTDVDVVTIHCYFQNPESAVGCINNMKAIMSKYGLSAKPLWDTEGSWGTYTLTTQQQVGFAARYNLLHWSSGVSRFYWYAWDGANWGPLWDPVNGIHPAAIAYQQVHDWMVGATMSSPCTMAPDSTWSCTLTRGGSQALAVWNSATTTSYTPASGFTQYLDLTGNTNPVSGSVTIGYEPILLVNSGW